MAKRFTDTAKWKKEFIKGLDAKHKLLWFYILDDCDHAGVWEVDFEVAALRIGEDVNYGEAFVALGQQIEVVGKNKWWIKDFISFQYGNLTPKNKMFKPVMDVLSKFNIPHNMEHLSPIDGVKVKDKDKVEVKDKDKVKDITPDLKFEYELKEKAAEVVHEIHARIPIDKSAIIEAILNDEIYVEQLQMTHRGKNIGEAFEECYTHHSNAPNPPREIWEWKQKLNTWLSIKRKDNGSDKKGTNGTYSRREAFARRHGASPDSR